MSSTLAPPCRIVNVMWYYVFHVSFTECTGPEELEGRMYRFSLLAPGPRDSGPGAHRPEELEGGEVRSFINSFFIPARPEGGRTRPLDGCTGAEAPR